MNSIKNVLSVILLSFVWTLYACSNDHGSVNVTPDFSLGRNGEKVSQLTFDGSSSFVMLTLQSNVAWTVQSDQDWCRLSNRSGEATLTDYQIINLKVEVGTNPGADVREATITLQAGGQTQDVSVRQYGLQSPDSSGWETATEAVANMNVGLNIGNSLDSYGSWISGSTPEDFETAWGNSVITRQLVQTMRQAGFKAVRLPVTWFQHLDADNRVDEAWMARVEEVVNYILDEDMYCILNVHHDCGASEEAWLLADLANYESISTRFAVLWQQIAIRFADYGEKLLFEGYNEMLDANRTWTSTDTDGYQAHNQLAQLFVNTVRATGGNNAVRNLILCTYSADPGSPTINNFIVPDDSVLSHLLVEVHVYAPGSFTSPAEGSTPPAWADAHAQELLQVFSGLENRFTAKGIPLIIGEWGAQGNSTDGERAKYAACFMQEARRQGIASFYWFDLLDRTTYEWKYPAVRDAILNTNN